MPAPAAPRPQTRARTRPPIAAEGRAPGTRALLTVLSLAIVAVGVPIVKVMRSCEHLFERSGSRAA